MLTPDRQISQFTVEGERRNLSGAVSLGSKLPFAFAETLDDAPAAKLTLVFRL